MGCAQAKQEERGEKVDYKNVPASNPSYPPPYVPQLTRNDVFDEEANKALQDRIDQMPKLTDSKYVSLLKYLSDGATKEIQHVTAIYLWMKGQDYHSNTLDLEKPMDTPRGYMKLIKEGSGNLTTFFTILCRRSGIPCIMLRGVGKSEQYTIGTSEQNMHTEWCAVYADDEWRLAHIEWAINGSKDKNQNNANSDASDFYFLTNPDEFAVICHPENFNWQLLSQPFSKREFLNLPNIRPKFFHMNMAFISPKVGTVKTHKGKTEVEVSFPKKWMSNIKLQYHFYFKQELSSNKHEQDGGDDKKMSVPEKLQRYVFMIRKPSRFIFEVNMPAAGKYLFDIYGKIENTAGDGDSDGNTSQNTSERLCQFRLISEMDPDPGEVEPLPECPDIGWGPGPVCKQLGLIPLTHFDSLIYIKPGDVREIKFKMVRKLEVQCQLTHNYLPLYQLVEQVERETVQNEAHVRVKIPEEGQYALKIYCREIGTKEYFEACIYLLRQQVQARFPEKHRDKMLRSRLEHHLDNHTSEKELKDALNVFECYNVPDHGEKKRTSNKLKQYWEVKKELNLAVKGRNPHVLQKWLARAKHSKYKGDLQDEIQKAEVVEEHMMKLKGYHHPIARMDPHTMIEIRNYKRPPPVVHDVMTSTYLLLGEQRYNLEEWEQIQYLMGKHGKDSLQKQIVNRHVDDVPVPVADEAEAIIQPYSLQKCREVSNGIGSFYRWNKQFIHDIHQKDLEEQQQLEENLKLAGRETFRDTYREPDAVKESRTSTSMGSDGGKSKGRTSPGGKETDNHPFAIEETDEVEKTPRKFFITPFNPPETNQSNAVEYAGFKPYEH